MKQLFYLLLAFVLVGNPLIAQTYVNVNAGGANDGSSWSNAYTSLADALDNTTTGEIWVAAGIYLPGSDSSDFFSISSEVALYGGFAGTETSLDDRDWETNLTILSGDLLQDDVGSNVEMNREDNSLQVLYVDSMLTGPITIDGFQISGGQANLDDGANGDDPRYLWTGAGIYGLSPVQISNCYFTANAARSGGSVALYELGTAGSSIEDCVFEENFSNSQSAGVFLLSTQNIEVLDCDFINNTTNRGALYPSDCSDVIIDNCYFEGNENDGGYGAAMFAWQPENLSITNCEFSGNTSGNAAGIYVDQRNLSGQTIQSVIFDNCVFDGNVTTDYGGTGIFFFEANFTILNSTFSNNTAPSSAPAIYMGGDDDSGYIFNSSFTGNSANFAGGIANYNGNSDLTIESCTFSSNMANNGGGSLSGGFLANTTVMDCLFDGNTGGYGGAIFIQNDSTEMTIINSTFLNNTAATSGGGALLTNSSIPVTVEGSTFELNSSEEAGGAISVTEDSLDASILTLSNSYFNFNISGNQGGALNVNNADTYIESCVFLNNNAADTGTGGAISFNSSTGGVNSNLEAAIMNSTFADNLGALADGIASWTEPETDASLNLTLQNNIFSHFGLDYAIEDGTPTVASNGGNLTTASSSDILTDAADILDESPMFVNITDFDLHLEDGSPCIDAGVANGAPDTDIEGNPRVGGIDIGAYENQQGTATEDLPLFDRNQLSLFPNPVREQAQLKMNNDWLGELQVVIYTIDGKLSKHFMIQKVNEEQQFAVPVAGLQHGAYKVLVSNGSKVLATHLVKL